MRMTEQQSDTPENELEELVTSALDGHASASDVQELETLLISSEENRRAYLDRVGFEDALEGAVKVGVLWSSPVIEPAQNSPHAKVDGTSRSGRGVSVRMLSMALFSTALIALLCVVLSLRQSPDQKYFTPESGGASAGLAVNGVAVVASQADVLWESPIVLSGAVLPRGEHHIQSGVMHLELFSGVQLVIEGEADFFFNDTAATEIYTLSLHDSLPISNAARSHKPASASTESFSHASSWALPALVKPFSLKGP